MDNSTSDFNLMKLMPIHGRLYIFYSFDEAIHLQSPGYNSKCSSWCKAQGSFQAIYFFSNIRLETTSVGDTENAKEKILSSAATSPL